MGDENDSVRVYLRNFLYHSFSACLPGLREYLFSCNQAGIGTDGNRDPNEFPNTLAITCADSNANPYPIANAHAHTRPAGRIYTPFFG